VGIVDDKDCIMELRVMTDEAFVNKVNGLEFSLNFFVTLRYYF
jgi:hypothetical protein